MGCAALRDAGDKEQCSCIVCRPLDMEGFKGVGGRVAVRCMYNLVKFAKSSIVFPGGGRGRQRRQEPRGGQPSRINEEGDQ